MTRKDISDMIAGVGIPYAYYQFKKKDAPGGPPFICFLYPERDDFLADDTNYRQITALRVELYTDAPDFALEDSVETALAGAGLVFSKNGPEYIQSERMYMTTYETATPLEADQEADDTTATPTEEPPTNDTEVLEQNAEQG